MVTVFVRSGIEAIRLLLTSRFHKSPSKILKNFDRFAIKKMKPNVTIINNCQDSMMESALTSLKKMKMLLQNKYDIHPKKPQGVCRIDPKCKIPGCAFREDRLANVVSA